ncbi:hypothetical protein Fmac_011327 [Flemingia macrophylla]|uniref:Uncharacterized protein n=1 Tax=Flemingia macrophylla TaxID=520843 RepID=A0ABD1MM48_9FABA
MKDGELDQLYVKRRDQLKEIVASIISPKIVQAKNLNGKEFVSFQEQVCCLKVFFSFLISPANNICLKEATLGKPQQYCIPGSNIPQGNFNEHTLCASSSTTLDLHINHGGLDKNVGLEENKGAFAMPLIHNVYHVQVP